jgi:hypothetical protein
MKTLTEKACFNIFLFLIIGNQSMIIQCYQVSTEIAITPNTYVYWSEWNAIEGFKKSIRGIKIIIFYFQTE